MVEDQRRFTNNWINVIDLAAVASKAYHNDLNSGFFESGVGLTGVYDSHFHRGFTDVLYSPRGIVVRTGGVLYSGSFIAVSPRVSYVAEVLPNFWFMKFFQNALDASVSVPDKVEAPASHLEGPIFSLDTGTVSFRYHGKENESGVVNFSITVGRLVVATDKGVLLATVYDGDR